MKTIRPVKYLAGKSSSGVIRESTRVAAAGVEATPEIVSVRTAKAMLSALLDKVAAGAEVLITSDGRPKARLVPLEREPSRKVFTGTPPHLKRIPWRGATGSPDSTQLISEDRDARGW